MGNRNCSNINTFSDVCNLGDCLVNYQSLGSNSASPTEITILKLKDESRYNGAPILPEQQAFIKWWVSPNKLDELQNMVKAYLNNNIVSQDFQFIADKIVKSDVPTLKGLEYEMLIYQYIITPLVNLGSELLNLNIEK